MLLEGTMTLDVQTAGFVLLAVCMLRFGLPVAAGLLVPVGPHLVAGWVLPALRRIQRALTWPWESLLGWHGQGPEAVRTVLSQGVLSWVVLSCKPQFQTQPQPALWVLRVAVWVFCVRCLLASCVKPVWSWRLAGKLLLAVAVLAGDCGRVLGPGALCGLLVLGACGDQGLVMRLVTYLETWELDCLEGFENELVEVLAVTVNLMLCGFVSGMVLGKASSSLPELALSGLNGLIAVVRAWHLVVVHVLPGLARLWVLPRANQEELRSYDDVCAVCHAPMAAARSGASCRHLFHGKCLRPLLGGAIPRCPLCQAGLLPGPVARG